MIGVNYLPEKTGIGPYSAGLAEHLARRGHEVEVVTGLPSYPEWKVHESFRRLLWRNEVKEGVMVHRRWHYVPGSQTAVRRLLYEASFFLTGLSALFLRKPDLVVGVVPSLSGGAVARLVARHFGAPYVLIFQDLMGPAATQTGLSGAHRVAALVKTVERRIASKAARVGVIAEGFRPYLESLGVDPERIFRLRNWSRVADPTEDRATTRKELGLAPDQIVCLHAGNMGHKQDLANILECALLASGANLTLEFILLGDGNQRQSLQELASGHDLRNLRFLPLQSDEAFSNVLAAADILLLNQRPGVAEMSLPSKLTAYLAAQRPIVAAVDQNSESAREVTEAGAGIIVPPGKPEALLRSLAQLALDKALRDRLGRRGRDHASTTLSSSCALPPIEEFLTSVISTRGRSGSDGHQ